MRSCEESQEIVSPFFNPDAFDAATASAASVLLRGFLKFGHYFRRYSMDVEIDCHVLNCSL